MDGNVERRHNPKATDPAEVEEGGGVATLVLTSAVALNQQSAVARTCQQATTKEHITPANRKEQDATGAESIIQLL